MWTLHLLYVSQEMQQPSLQHQTWAQSQYSHFCSWVKLREAERKEKSEHLVHLKCWGQVCPCIFAWFWHCSLETGCCPYSGRVVAARQPQRETLQHYSCPRRFAVLDTCNPGMCRRSLRKPYNVLKAVDAVTGSRTLRKATDECSPQTNPCAADVGNLLWKNFREPSIVLQPIRSHLMHFPISCEQE